MKDLGQADVAIKNYQKAIEINPSFAHAYNNLGSTLMSLGRLKESILSFEKAISLDPRNILAHNNLGTVLSTLGQLNAGAKSSSSACLLIASTIGFPSSPHLPTSGLIGISPKNSF